MKKKICIYSFIGLFVYWIIPFTSFASSAQQYITVTPSIINLDFATDPPVADLTYSNKTPYTVELQLSASDFAPLEDGYRMDFLQKKDAKNYKYSLSSWISFETNDITLNPNETKTIKVFVDKNRLTTGGHYASIQAQWIKTANDNSIPMNVTLSSLLFVRTAHGNETEEATIDELALPQDAFAFPDNAVVKIKNTGNVEINPHGLVEIKDLWNNTIARGTINDNSLLALPESIRRYDTPITTQQSYIPPGIYHADMYVHFGKKNRTLRKSIMFFSQGNVNLIPYAVGIIIVGVIGWRLMRKRKRISNS
jgi:hypothetical protein